MKPLLLALPALAALAAACTENPSDPSPAASAGAGVGGVLAASGGGAGGVGAGSSGEAGTALGGSAAGSGASPSAGTSGGGASAGMVGNAGSAGSGGSAGSAGQPSTCVTSGKELCEDFESGTLDTARWSLTKPTASAKVVVDETRPRRGKYALHITLEAGQSSTAQIADSVTFPATDNTFYTRAYFYFSPDLPADDNGGFHMAFLLATGNNDLGFVEAGLGSAGDKQYLGYSEYYGAGPNKHEHGPTFTEFGPRSETRVVPKQWLCLELMQGGDASTTQRRVWVDGKELNEQKNDYKDRKPPQFERVSIGVLQYHPTPLLSEVWVDDIRVSRQPIGCDK